MSLFLAHEKDQECLTYLEDITLVRGGDKKDLNEYDLAFVSHPSSQPLAAPVRHSPLG